MKENKLVELKDCNVKDIDIKDLVPNVIDNVIINIVDDAHTIFLPPDMTSMQFSNFTNSKGGTFSKDVLRYTKGKPHGKYVLVEQAETDLILRLIEEEEWLKFQVAGLMHGIVKDTPYMLLKEVKKGEPYTTTKVNKIIVEEIPEVDDNEDMVSDDELPLTNMPLFE